MIKVFPIIAFWFLLLMPTALAHDGGHYGCYENGCPPGHSYTSPYPWNCPWTDPPCDKNPVRGCDIRGNQVLPNGTYKLDEPSHHEDYANFDVCSDNAVFDCSGSIISSTYTGRGIIEVPTGKKFSGVTIKNCVINNPKGFYLNDFSTVIQNTFKHPQGTMAVKAQQNSIVSENTISGFVYGVQIISSTSPYSGSEVVESNYINATGTGILVFSGSSRISGNTIKMNPSGYPLGGILIKGYATITGNNINFMPGGSVSSIEGISVENQISGGAQNTISNNTLFSPSPYPTSGIGYGISAGGTYTRIADNHITGFPRTGIQLAVSGAPSGQNLSEITGNNVTGTGSFLATNTYGIYASGSNITISKNNISDNIGGGIYVTVNSTIYGNIIANNSRTAICSSCDRTSATESNIISGNILSGNGFEFPGQAVVRVHSRNLIEGNTLEGNAGGIQIFSADNNLSGNRILFNQGDGILFYSTYGITKTENLAIEHNIISGNDIHGINAYCISNSRIDNNIITLNNRSGVHFNCISPMLAVKNVSISLNNISLNKDHGIYFFPIYKSYPSAFPNELIRIENSTFEYNGISGIETPRMLRKSVISGNVFTYNMLNISTSSSTIFNNTLIKGDSINRGRGFHIFSSSLSNITNNSILDQFPGMHITDSFNNTISENYILQNIVGLFMNRSGYNTIFNNTLVRNSREGMFLYNSSFNNISLNQVNSSRFSGMLLDFESSGNSLESNLLFYNGNMGAYFNQMSGIFIDHNSSNNRIDLNTIKNSTRFGIGVWRTSGNSLTNNTIEDNRDDGINLCDAHQDSVEGNVVVSSWGDEGIHIYEYSGYNTLRNNTIRTNVMTGVTLGSSQYLCRNYLGEEINDVRDIDPFSHGSGEGNIIENNNIFQNGQGNPSKPSVFGNGIDVYMTSGTRITGNIIYKNIGNINGRYKGSGIMLEEGSENNVIEGNTIQGNAHHGIYILNSRSNTIKTNTVSGHPYASLRPRNMIIKESFGVSEVFHRIIPNSTLQTESSNSISGNFRNKGCPSGYISYNFPGYKNWCVWNRIIPPPEASQDVVYFHEGTNWGYAYSAHQNGTLLNSTLPVMITGKSFSNTSLQINISSNITESLYLSVFDFPLSCSDCQITMETPSQKITPDCTPYPGSELVCFNLPLENGVNTLSVTQPSTASIHVEGRPGVGTRIEIPIADYTQPNTEFILFLSVTGTRPGIVLPDSRSIPLNYDGISEFSLFYPQYMGLQNSQGVLDEYGESVVVWDIPRIPLLSGITFYAAFATIHSWESVPQAIKTLSSPVNITIQR